MNGTLNLRCGAGLTAGMSATIAAGTATPYAGGRCHGSAITADAGGVAVVAWQPGQVLDLPGNAWAPGTGVWAAAVGGYTQADPGGGETDQAYLGVAITGTMLLLDLPAFRSSGGVGTVEVMRAYDAWTIAQLTFSAGTAASMDAAATATGAIHADATGATSIELCAAWTYGAGPAAPPTANVYRSSDGGTTYETEPWYEDLGDTATPVALDAAVTMWRIPASDVLQVVLTNETGEAITDVSLAWRAVR